MMEVDIKKELETLDRNELTQVFMRGYFAGWSEREVAQLADKLAKNEQDYPLWIDKKR